MLKFCISRALTVDILSAIIEYLVKIELDYLNIYIKKITNHLYSRLLVVNMLSEKNILRISRKNAEFFVTFNANVAVSPDLLRQIVIHAKKS